MGIKSCVTAIFLLILLISCGVETKKETGVSIQENTILDKKSTEPSKDIDLIKSVYSIFVFAIDADNDDIHHPEKFFTAHALDKLRKDYEFDCEEEPCYAYYAMRTDAQDSKPGSDEESTISSIEPTNDGWYMVSYLDMGWPGKTRIKLSDGKIDDYERHANNESNRY